MALEVIHQHLRLLIN